MELLGLQLLLFIEIGWRFEVLTCFAAVLFVICTVWKHGQRICAYDKAPESRGLQLSGALSVLGAPGALLRTSACAQLLQISSQR